ncbi:MAG TPA: Flp pilus assembly protein CpaB [Rhizomicrobium sp.]|jgi:pilus assembly protein CpaB
MDRSRIIVLAVAAVAAGGVALLARSLLGGGTPQTAAAPAPQIVTSEVLVAASQLAPGTALTPASVRWQNWPRSSVDSSFITQTTAPDIGKIVQGAVARSPMVPGEPLTPTKIVHADPSGFMAARLEPGMRALSISISVDTGAGGFILPDDRVDVLCTQQAGERKYQTRTILKDVRVLAVDQTYDSTNTTTKTVVGRTATLELSPSQSELIERAKAGGTLSLALRALGDNGSTPANATTTASNQQSDDGSANNQIDILRYGVERSSIVGAKE